MEHPSYERVSGGDRPRQASRRNSGSYVLALLLSLAAIAVTLALSRRAERRHIRAARCMIRSPAYPSAGGPGCASRCTAENRSSAAGFRNGSTPWPEDLVRNMHSAAAILKRFGTPVSLDTERSFGLHAAFQYFCCYSPQETAVIESLLRSYQWVTRKISFDHLECAVHAPDSQTSLVLMGDAQSQKLIADWTLDFEREMEKVGIRMHVPHTRLQAFHMTLGVVNESTLPVNTAVDAINNEIRPSTWHAEPIPVHRPVFSS